MHLPATVVTPTMVTDAVTPVVATAVTAAMATTTGQRRRGDE
jgi:hypothetical protein